MGLLSFLQPRSRCALLLSYLAGLLASATAAAQTLATSVPLVTPSVIAFDARGNLYIAETAKHIIRKVDLAGQISTIAGTGTQGFAGDGGQAAAALLDSPQGLAVDPSSLYIADTHNNRIRKVDLVTGIITTIAGGAIIGTAEDGGPAVTATTLDTPTAIALDANENLYIAEVRRHRIRKIAAASGIITTVAGTGTQGFDGDGNAATAALIDSPGGLAVDSSGNIFLADSHNHRVRRIDAITGAITTLAGNAAGYAGDAGSAVTSRLALPQGLSIDQQGNLYLTDTANHRVRRIDGKTGMITTIAGDGTQGFAGDGAAATAASLDSPRAVTIAPASAVTIADTGNRRIRQIGSDSSLQTVAGLGAAIPGALTLSGLSRVGYGSGILLATLTGTNATGSITFLDSYAGTTTTAGIVSIASNVAMLDTSEFRVGQHAILATYTGDGSHSAAQSAVFALTVSPLPSTVSIMPSSVSYGGLVPPLHGSLSGLLPRDQSTVLATLAINADALSPAGSYPVTINLSGPGAGNYELDTPPVFTITRAATTMALSVATPSLNPVSSVNSGDFVTISAHVASATTGVPTGMITIFDSASVVATGKASATGDLTFTTNTFSVGSHNLTAVYAGDSNFTGNTSPQVAFTVITTQANPADFTFAVTGAAAQTIVSGASASFTFSVQMQGGLSSPIALAASGLPNLATTSFNPAYIPPGSGPASVTLTVTPPKTARNEQKQRGGKIIFVFVAFPLSLIRVGRLRAGKRTPSVAALLLLLVSLHLCVGCGDRIYTGRAVDTSKTYTITVTGTATSPTGATLQHAATVTLIVLPAS